MDNFNFYPNRLSDFGMHSKMPNFPAGIQADVVNDETSSILDQVDILLNGPAYNGVGSELKSGVMPLGRGDVRTISSALRNPKGFLNSIFAADAGIESGAHLFKSGPRSAKGARASGPTKVDTATKSAQLKSDLDDISINNLMDTKFPTPRNKSQRRIPSARKDVKDSRAQDLLNDLISFGRNRTTPKGKVQFKPSKPRTSASDKGIVEKLFNDVLNNKKTVKSTVTPNPQARRNTIREIALNKEIPSRSNVLDEFLQGAQAGPSVNSSYGSLPGKVLKQSPNTGKGRLRSLSAEDVAIIREKGLPPVANAYKGNKVRYSSNTPEGSGKVAWPRVKDPNFYQKPRYRVDDKGNIHDLHATSNSNSLFGAGEAPNMAIASQSQYGFTPKEILGIAGLGTAGLGLSAILGGALNGLKFNWGNPTKPAPQVNAPSSISKMYNALNQATPKTAPPAPPPKTSPPTEFNGGVMGAGMDFDLTAPTSNNNVTQSKVMPAAIQPEPSGGTMTSGGKTYYVPQAKPNMFYIDPQVRLAENRMRDEMAAYDASTPMYNDKQLAALAVFQRNGLPINMFMDPRRLPGAAPNPMQRENEFLNFRNAANQRPDQMNMFNAKLNATNAGAQLDYDQALYQMKVQYAIAQMQMQNALTIAQLNNSTNFQMKQNELESNQNIANQNNMVNFGKAGLDFNKALISSIFSSPALKPMTSMSGQTVNPIEQEAVQKALINMAWQLMNNQNSNNMTKVR